MQPLQRTVEPINVEERVGLDQLGELEEDAFSELRAAAPIVLFEDELKPPRSVIATSLSAPVQASFFVFLFTLSPSHNEEAPDGGTTRGFSGSFWGEPVTEGSTPSPIRR